MMTDEELLRMAKIGIAALVDEATGYQEDRPSDALARMNQELKGGANKLARSSKP